MSPFKFNIGDKVTLLCSNESGIVIGRAEYSNTECSYLIRYRAADARAVEQWWSESALV
jgi:hypothetical protein